MAFPTRLTDLSVDVLSVICEIVDIGSLLCSGNPVLSAKLRSAAQKVRCERPGCSLFPLSLFELPCLRELDISIVKRHQDFHIDFPLRLKGGLPLPASPKPDLKVLRLSFAQSFLVFDACAPSLCDLLPNLTELHLVNSKQAWQASWLSKLPPKLVKLSLSPLTSRTSPFMAIVDVACLSRLPSTLEELVLSDVTFVSSIDGASSWQSVIWPHALRKLHLFGLYASEVFFEHIPSTLEDLGVEYMSMRDGFEVPLSKLPRTLRRLKVWEASDDFVVRVTLDGSPLPPNIEYWDAVTNWHALLDGKGDDEDAEGAAMRNFVPTSLKEVRDAISGDAFMEPPSFYRFLPLTSLVLYNTSPRIIPFHLTVQRCRYKVWPSSISSRPTRLDYLFIFVQVGEFESRKAVHCPLELLEGRAQNRHQIGTTVSVVDRSLSIQRVSLGLQISLSLMVIYSMD